MIRNKKKIKWNYQQIILAYLPLWWQHYRVRLVNKRFDQCVAIYLIFWGAGQSSDKPRCSPVGSLPAASYVLAGYVWSFFFTFAGQRWQGINLRGARLFLLGENGTSGNSASSSMFGGGAVEDIGPRPPLCKMELKKWTIHFNELK